MTKRVRLSDSFNPVYPYEDESTSQHPFINPGFISPNGFTQSPDGVLTLNCLTPLTTTGGPLQLKVGGGLIVDDTDGTLQENIRATAPITKNNHSVELSIGNGLETQNNKLCAKLGNGLKFNNGDICIKDSINTLWTGIKPPPNCQIVENTDTNDGKLTLVLVKNGGLVNGYVSLVGVSDTVNQMFTQKSATIQLRLYFDSSGNLLTDESNLKIPLKNKSSTATSEAATSSKAFMPSTTAYPFNTSTRDSENYIHGICYYMTSYDRSLVPLNISIMLNSRTISSNVAYAIQFEWNLNAKESPESNIATLTTSPFFFSYIREDDN